MKPDELDRVLWREPKIIPSSGFARSVMAAVRSEAAALPPIPFPWKRALPGLSACVFAIVWALVDSGSTSTRASASLATSELAGTLTQSFDSVLQMLGKAQMLGAGWVLFALLLTFAGLKLTWHLTGRRVY